MEAVQGKELERIFKEEGVIDEEDDNHETNTNTKETLTSSIQNGQEGLHIILKILCKIKHFCYLLTYFTFIFRNNWSSRDRGG